MPPQAAPEAGTVSGFDGGERTLAGDLTPGGEVAGVMVGADWTRRDWTVGLTVSHSRGASGDRGLSDAGEVSPTLTGTYPYGRFRVTDGVPLWGVTGSRCSRASFECVVCGHADLNAARNIRRRGLVRLHGEGRPGMPTPVTSETDRRLAA